MGPNETLLGFAFGGLALRGGEDRDTKSRHLLRPNEPLDLAARGLVLGGKGAERQI